MRIFKLILITLIFSIQLTAQTAEDAVNLLEDEQGFGLRAMALGNSYTALANDYSGIYYNPAGLADVKVGQFSASISNFNQQTDADFLGNSFSEDLSSTKFQSLGLVFPFPVVRGSFVMALGYQKIKDYENYLKIDGYQEDSNGLDLPIICDLNEDGIFEDYGNYLFDEQMQQNFLMETEGNLSQWSFGLAMDFSPNFSAGFSINLYDGYRNDNFKYSQDTLNDWNSWNMNTSGAPAELIFKYYELQQKIESEFSGLNIKIGGLFDIISERLKLGAMVTIPVYFKVEENWAVNDEIDYTIIRNDSIFDIRSPAEDSSPFEYNINEPFKFNFGLSYTYSIFLITADLGYCDWSQLRYKKPSDQSSENYIGLLNQNQVFKDEFRAVTSFSIGAEIKLLKNKLKLRGGYREVPSPLKELGSDYNKRYISTGVGYQVDKNTLIHLNYIRGSWKNNKYYSYDNYDTYGDYLEYAKPLSTSEDYVTSKILLGVQFNFR